MNPNIVKSGEIYFCKPEPTDTVGSEQDGDRPWVIVSQTHLHRGNCVVAVPLTTNLAKACAHLPKIPKDFLVIDGNRPPTDSVALTDQVRTLDKTRLRRLAGNISDRGLAGIRIGLEKLFGI